MYRYDTWLYSNKTFHGAAQGAKQLSKQCYLTLRRSCGNSDQPIGCYDSACFW